MACDVNRALKNKERLPVPREIYDIMVKIVTRKIFKVTRGIHLGRYLQSGDNITIYVGFSLMSSKH